MPKPSQAGRRNGLSYLKLPHFNPCLPQQPRWIAAGAAENVGASSTLAIRPNLQLTTGQSATEFVLLRLCPGCFGGWSVDLSSMKTTTNWKTAPISCTCEVETTHPMRICDKPTTAAYPALGGGWMALCEYHAQEHMKHGGASGTDELIWKGEVWQ